MSLVLTRMQNIRAKAELDKWEQRPSYYGVFDLFARDTEHPFSIISQELKEKAFASIGSTLQVPVIDYDGSVTIGSTRSVTIADDENTSAMQTITFATYSFGFTQVETMFLNNEIDMERDWEAKFLKYLYAFGAALDTAGITVLTTNKTQVMNDVLDFANTANVLTSTRANEQKIIGALNSVFQANDYNGENLNVVGNTGLKYLIGQMDEKAVYNSENKTIQYSDKALSYSNRIANVASSHAGGFAVVPGSLGLLTRVDREALMGVKSKTGHEWSVETLPLLNIPVGVLTYESVGDFSAIAGAATADMTAAHKIHYGFSVDVAFVAPYASDLASNPSPILKFNVTDA